MTLSIETVEQAKAFANWKPDPNVDNTIKCNRCNKWYDYRVFLIHKCNAR